MNQSTLLLARHGECQSNFENIFIERSQDPPLTRTGKEQADRLAKALKKHKISKIFSSPLLRTRLTSKIIGDHLQIEVQYSDDLVEVDLGILDGLDIGNPRYLSVYNNMVANWERGYPHASVPQGESLVDIRIRIDRFLKRHIYGKERDGAVLLVGHAILWMCFIWLFCENRSQKINDGFMDKSHISIVSTNGRPFYLRKTNLNLEQVKICQFSDLDNLNEFSSFYH